MSRDILINTSGKIMGIVFRIVVALTLILVMLFYLLVETPCLLTGVHRPQSRKENQWLGRLLKATKNGGKFLRLNNTKLHGTKVPNHLSQVNTTISMKKVYTMASAVIINSSVQSQNLIPGLAGPVFMPRFPIAALKQRDSRCVSSPGLYHFSQLIA
jgi:hypothetical protein